MDFPADTIAVFEENRTRADLYAMWLDDYDVRVAAKRSRADDILDDEVVVAVLSQGFADGDASQLLEAVRSRAPLCRVLATRERSAAFSDLPVDRYLVKPVFEDELVEGVETLLKRSNYHLALALYYQTTIDLSSFEVVSRESSASEGKYEDLRQRATHLQALIADLISEMSEEDVRTVKRAATFDTDLAEVESAEKLDSKYRPEKCSNCGRSWNSASGPDADVSQLGAYVWRCTGCGHVQMGTDPSHRDVADKWR